MKRKLSIEVRGKQHRWSFTFDGDPQHIEEWRADGLVISEVVDTIPAWVVNAGLLRPWVFVQDMFNFRNPFKR